MLILGINAWHPDAAACVLHDGVLIAAAEEERFVRRKHFAGFPGAAVRYCLREAGARGRDIDGVAVNSDPGANRWSRLAFALRRPPPPSLLLERIRARRRRGNVMALLRECLDDDPGAARVTAVEHHRAHMAAAFFCSPFERAAVVSVDGFGDFASAATGHGEGDTLRVCSRVLFPHSLGIFYQAMTQYLGFPAYGDEYKVMGLAPYGEPVHAGALARVVRTAPGGRFELALEYFRHHRMALGAAGADGAPAFPALFTPALERLLGPARAPGAPLEQRHRDLARSVQQRYEQVLFHILRHAQCRDTGTWLALAGGCAMNSVANGRIREHTVFREVFVQPAAGDAGGALGAALCAERDARGRLTRHPMRSAALGPGFSDEALDRIIAAHAPALARAACDVTRIGDERRLCDDTAAAIAEGEVVGWFQGRMEWGPRALGQRSILADPRRADMRDVLNHKIKRRESFRPFAPSILRESVADWFEVDDDVPFMMKVYRVRKHRRASIPAVTHVDGTGRLQTVTAADAALYHRLITAFANLTRVPMVLNTSFNENEPIVCRPEEAIDCFLRTHMDRLVLGGFVLCRRADRKPASVTAARNLA